MLFRSFARQANRISAQRSTSIGPLAASLSPVPSTLVPAMAVAHSPSIAPASTALSGAPLSALRDFEFRQLKMPELSPSTIASSALVLVVTLLLLEQTLWRWRKGNLPGWKWQIVSVL